MTRIVLGACADYQGLRVNGTYHEIDFKNKCTADTGLDPNLTVATASVIAYWDASRQSVVEGWALNVLQMSLTIGS